MMSRKLSSCSESERINLPAEILDDEEDEDDNDNFKNIQYSHMIGQKKHGFGHCRSCLFMPPRPFKKARYACEIKNLEHTVQTMKEDLNSCVSSNSTSLSEPEDSDVPLENKHQEIDISDSLVHSGPDSCSVHQLFPGNLPDRSIPKYFDSSNPDLQFSDWHVLQLQRSIFENTVNRMIESVAYSGNEHSHVQPPLYLFNMGDKTYNQRNLFENFALSMALQQKAWFLPSYHNDFTEGNTTSDYDSSDEDSEFVDDESVCVLDINEHQRLHHSFHSVEKPLTCPQFVQNSICDVSRESTQVFCDQCCYANCETDEADSPSSIEMESVNNEEQRKCTKTNDEAIKKYEEEEENAVLDDKKDNNNDKCFIDRSILKQNLNLQEV